MGDRVKYMSTSFFIHLSIVLLLILLKWESALTCFLCNSWTLKVKGERLNVVLWLYNTHYSFFYCTISIKDSLLSGITTDYGGITVLGVWTPNLEVNGTVLLYFALENSFFALVQWHGLTCVAINGKHYDYSTS